MELNLGMSVPDWPPENIDELAKNMRILLINNFYKHNIKNKKLNELVRMESYVYEHVKCTH